MVVEPLDAVVADGAVGAARRAVEHARVAVLDLDHHAVDVHVARRGQRPRRAQAAWAGRRRRGGRRAVRRHELVLGVRRPRVPRDDPGVAPRRQHQHHHVLPSDFSHGTLAIVVC